GAVKIVGKRSRVKVGNSRYAKLINDVMGAGHSEFIAGAKILLDRGFLKFEDFKFSESDGKDLGSDPASNTDSGAQVGLKFDGFIVPHTTVKSGVAREFVSLLNFFGEYFDHKAVFDVTDSNVLKIRVNGTNYYYDIFDNT
ncbi:MAG: hypothetical protein LBD32_01210, partial [Cytophagales bacterium]|nr:hypothetical protein [Cytophagales bacterium]